MQKGLALDRVEQVLRSNPASRDSDVALFTDFYALYFSGSVSGIPFLTILNGIGNHVLPGFDTVRRLRQRVQENKIELRGSLYNKRHRLAETYPENLDKQFQSTNEVQA